LNVALDYNVPYSVMGFFPVTTQNAEAMVNAYAAAYPGGASAGWDYIRSLPMGIYDRQWKWTDGHYYAMTLEGDPADETNGVQITVYDDSDPNSVQSLGVQQQNITTATNTPPPSGFFDGISNFILWGVGIIAALAVINTVRK
jgi:hypothetical protein